MVVRPCYRSGQMVVRPCYRSWQMVVQPCYRSGQMVVRPCYRSGRMVVKPCYRSGKMFARPCLRSGKMVDYHCYVSEIRVLSVLHLGHSLHRVHADFDSQYSVPSHFRVNLLSLFDHMSSVTHDKMRSCYKLQLRYCRNKI